MNHREVDVRGALLNDVDLIQLELDRLQLIITSSPDILLRDEGLWKIHQSVSNIAITMRMGLQNSQF